MVWARALALMFVLGCRAHPSTATIDNARVASASADERCAMIEAALSIDEPQFQAFYRGAACGGSPRDRAERRVLVAVDIRPVFAAGEACSSDVFDLYRDGQPVSSDKLLQLSIGPLSSDTYGFTVSYTDPPNSPNDIPTADGGFESAQYYCHLINGRLGRVRGRWRAWVDLE